MTWLRLRVRFELNPQGPFEVEENPLWDGGWLGGVKPDGAATLEEPILSLDLNGHLEEVSTNAVLAQFKELVCIFYQLLCDCEGIQWLKGLCEEYVGQKLTLRLILKSAWVLLAI